jgi:hypothetical protein
LRNKSIFQISTLICLSSISICNLLIDLPTYVFLGDLRQPLIVLNELNALRASPIFDYRLFSLEQLNIMSPTTNKVPVVRLGYTLHHNNIKHLSKYVPPLD